MFKKNPLVSVLMTAHNREKHIADAIKSVLMQTFTSFELIIVDDASTDNTFEIAKKYAIDPRIRVYRNQTNIGDYPNRNYAASLARGQYIKYLDSDDLMYPYCLEVMLGPLMAEPRAGFAISGSKSWQGGPCPMLLTPRMCYQREFLGSGMFGYSPGSAIFRSQVLRELNLFSLKGPHSDYVFWLKACARYPCLLLPAGLYWYRVHSGQHLQSAQASRDSVIKPSEAWKALCDSSCPLNHAETEQAKKNLVYSVFKYAFLDAVRGNMSLALFRIKELKISLREWILYLRYRKRDRFAGTPFDEDGQYVIPDLSVYLKLGLFKKTI